MRYIALNCTIYDAYGKPVARVVPVECTKALAHQLATLAADGLTTHESLGACMASKAVAAKKSPKRKRPK